MAYEFQIDLGIGSDTGAQGRVFPSPVTFGQIFDGAPQFYAGSTITVQEILLIISEIIPGQEHLVDIDTRWFDPKIYIGTYQLENLISQALDTEAEGGQGFLTRNAHQIRRYSTYTIVANPDVPVASGDVFLVDNCNFGLVEESISFGGVTVTAAKPLVNAAMMSGTVSRQRAPLADRPYNQLLGRVGLFFNPGCRGVLLKQLISIINTIDTDYESYPNFECIPLGG